MVFEPVKLAVPSIRSTLFFLNNPAMPVARVSTTFSFRAMSTGKSMATLSHLMPIRLKRSRAVTNFSVVSSSVLLGMHPTRRQVPPSFGSFSTHSTFMPSCAARMAAVYPPGPDPMTTRSKSVAFAITIILCVSLTVRDYGRCAAVPLPLLIFRDISCHSALPQSRKAFFNIFLRPSTGNRRDEIRDRRVSDRFCQCASKGVEESAVLSACGWGVGS